MEEIMIKGYNKINKVKKLGINDEANKLYYELVIIVNQKRVIIDKLNKAKSTLYWYKKHINELDSDSLMYLNNIMIIVKSLIIYTSKLKTFKDDQLKNKCILYYNDVECLLESKKGL